MSPEYQYKVWAHRIKRQFQKDCRLPADWDCECLKCEAALAEEINNYHLIQCNSRNVVSDEPMGADVDSIPKENGVNTVDLGAITSAYEPVLNRTHSQNVGGNIVCSRYISIFFGNRTLSVDR